MATKASAAAGAPAADDVADDEDEGSLLSASQEQSRRAKSPVASLASTTHDVDLANLTRQGEQIVKSHQDLISTMTAPSLSTERTLFHDWARTATASLDPDLWTKFQQENFSMVLKWVQ